VVEAEVRGELAGRGQHVMGPERDEPAHLVHHLDVDGLRCPRVDQKPQLAPPLSGVLGHRYGWDNRHMS
jgi:hypothetical protein